jgi:TetR/AcrR family transcriptional regulator, repressor for uid operon
MTTGERTARRGRPPAQRSEDTWERLLRAARVCFGTEGYAQTSMADIAREAGVTSRAIYHYVGSKQELFKQAADAVYQRFFEEVAARVLSEKKAKARMRGFVDVFRVLYREDPSLPAFVSQAIFEAKRNPELGDPLAGRGNAPAVNEYLVNEAVARGELADGIDPAGAVALLDVFGCGLTLVASADRGDDYLAMLDVLDRLIDGGLFRD